MLAYKVKGIIDEAGRLIVTEPINMNPGEVELVILQVVAAPESEILSVPQVEVEKPKREVECSIPILKEWLENTDPVPPDFDSDRAKWEYLKEKHNL